jgi:hypothetical protein
MGVVDDRLLRQWEFSKAEQEMSRHVAQRRADLRGLATVGPDVVEMVRGTRPVAAPIRSNEDPRD